MTNLIHDLCMNLNVMSQCSEKTQIIDKQVFRHREDISIVINAIYETLQTKELFLTTISCFSVKISETSSAESLKISYNFVTKYFWEMKLILFLILLKLYIAFFFLIPTLKAETLSKGILRFKVFSTIIFFFSFI